MEARLLSVAKRSVSTAELMVKDTEYEMCMVS